MAHLRQERPDLIYELVRRHCEKCTNPSCQMCNNLLHKMGVGPDGLLGQDVYEWLDFDNYRSLDTMPEYAMNKYRGWGAEMKEGKHPQILTYDGVPHLFVDGKIPTEGLEVITVD